MTREQLITVYEDTISRIESGEYTNRLDNIKLNLKNIRLDLKDRKNTASISVDNVDCIKISDELSKSGKTCLLNMASYKRPGGGVKNGAMAQEEELARRSNLMFGLPQEYYPLNMNEFIYTNNVTFFKDSNYHVINPFNCDVITIAAININNGNNKPIIPPSYEEIMIKKISNMLYVPYQSGCKNLVLSAFGCGVFKNDPYFVSGLFKKLLDSGFSSLYDRISFAILNDKNSVGSNFEIFKKVILDTSN